MLIDTESASPGHMDEVVSRARRHREVTRRIAFGLATSGRRAAPRESLPVGDMVEVVVKIETAAHGSGLGAGMALRFLVLTAARTSGVIGVRWSEIDLDCATWTIPAACMKGGGAHRVPFGRGSPCGA